VLLSLRFSFKVYIFSKKSIDLKNNQKQIRPATIKMTVSIIIYFVSNSLAIAVPGADEMRELFTAKGLESMVGFLEIKNPFVLKG